MSIYINQQQPTVYANPAVYAQKPQQQGCFILDDNNSEKVDTSLCASLDRFYCRLDKEFFNTCSYIPIVSNLTGAGRITLGSLQISTGVIGTIIEGVLSIATQNESHYKNFNICTTHIAHGILNQARGAAQIATPLINMFIFPAYDVAIDNSSGGILPYHCQNESTQLKERVIFVMQ